MTVYAWGFIKTSCGSGPGKWIGWCKEWKTFWKRHRQAEEAMTETEVALVGEGEGFTAQGMGTFSPSNYAEAASTNGTTLDFTGVERSTYPRKFETAPGAWRTATEEWGIEDWNGDLSETKIFIAYNVSSVLLPAENVTITAGQRIDLAVLLGKTPSSMEND